jgi:serine/threonine protein kinase
MINCSVNQALPSARFERYELRAELGRGGMAVVYEAFDRARDSVIALKCLSLERFAIGKPRDRVVALFEREYYALSQLTHPHIIQAYDYGIDPQGPYYTMELLAGKTLRAKAPLPWVERQFPKTWPRLHIRICSHSESSCFRTSSWLSVFGSCEGT